MRRAPSSPNPNIAMAASLPRENTTLKTDDPYRTPPNGYGTSGGARRTGRPPVGALGCPRRPAGPLDVDQSAWHPGGSALGFRTAAAYWDRHGAGVRRDP